MKTLVGFDLVDCNRFIHWYNRSDKSLQKIFSDEEISYCRSQKIHSASRFAARFAAREAFYKALDPLKYTVPLSFLSLCKAVHVTKASNGAPYLHFNAQAFEAFYAIDKILHVSLSLSHTPMTAGAVIIVTLE